MRGACVVVTGAEGDGGRTKGTGEEATVKAMPLLGSRSHDGRKGSGRVWFGTSLRGCGTVEGLVLWMRSTMVGPE